MPLSVMLAGYLGEFRKGMRPLEPWQSLTERFELVVDRLRSAYLVRWFGTGLPTQGVTLKVTLANIDQLRARWFAVGADQKNKLGPPGPNMLEPLLGTAGLMTGVLAAPLNAMLLTPIIWRLFDGVTMKIGAVVNWLTFGGLLTALLPIGALAVALGLPLMAGSAEARALYDLLGALARMAKPFNEFWGQIVGPRSRVKNPLLRVVLNILDGVAAVAIQLVGITSVLIVRVGPMVAPLMAGGKHFAAAALELVAMILEAVSSTAEGLHDWVTQGALRVLRSVIGLFAALMDTMQKMLLGMGPKLTELFGFDVKVTRMTLSGTLSSLADFAKGQTSGHPTVRYLQSFIGSVGVWSAWSERTKDKDTSPPGWLGRQYESLKLKALYATGMPVTKPHLPLPDDLLPLTPAPTKEGVFWSALGTANPFVADEKALRHWARPPSVFGGEWEALRREKESPESPVRMLAAADYLARIEPLLMHNIGDAAEAQMFGLLPALEQALGRLDDALHPKRNVTHPTKLLDTPREIRPVIGALRVRADATDDQRPRFEGFVAALREQFDGAPYLVPAGGSR